MPSELGPGAQARHDTEFPEGFLRGGVPGHRYGVYIAEQCVGADRVGCELRGLLCFYQRLLRVIRGQQVARGLRMSDRGGDWNVEVSLINEHSVIDDIHRLERFELLVRIELRAGTELESRENTGADSALNT